ncbi:MAG: type II secretion system minor pseudopilin GspK [Candidatus Binatus sp.]|uniref:type II secretion system minor pseudopilin GspK n=1 Tax=Candidatus Binatus sp. TaxID=2811406 RepID=UPI00271977C2|nr:type II secretion system minor pseudopilin GspK [Candidatus Binatus sp.]MDO8432966.1 type II secretion system minor pseudopilin GspK [Candidatus Binatus sp.]
MVTRLKKNERGIALLAVLLGIALMTMLVVDFAMSAGLGYVSAANQANELRAYYLARSGISVGIALLAADARAQTQTESPADSLLDRWAMPFPPMPLEGGVVSLSVVDEARKLAINSLIDPNKGVPNAAAVQRLMRLFTILGVSPDLVPAILDWTDPDETDSPGGAEANYYLSLRPPYQPRNGPMPTLGDLRMVRGVSEAVYNRIAPFLTVMPELQVNANTASPQVLASLEPELMEDPKIVEQIMAVRLVQPFTKVTDVANLPSVGTIGTRLTQDITTRSQFFTIRGMGIFAGARKTVSATFHREQNGTGTLATWNED